MGDETSIQIIKRKPAASGEVIRNGETNIGMVITDLEIQYGELKKEAEDERLKTVAYWFSLGEKEKEGRYNQLKKHTSDEELDQAGVLPPYNFFSEQLGPAIREFVKEDPVEFKRIAELGFEVIKEMYKIPVSQGATKRFMIGKVFDQYFRFLI
ncbi:hypothetical protein HN695_04825 [Candidatus Woesearchaeota archaeon]|jgi:hypothetical protein|nr:hypothetical protein [Candidatus Woesearchaeota archaeon]MBT5272047.1 hypothetical protein [Candidatus Woesearchaeota archaeon]MBT6041797.1 hypothetical protein [Candidatus Woesearchaeota archaeon]MBT6336828.1 hypothetical protein [Candidatus Woesearchaeota archaeon]MBT7927637.1 hypothetical protein [Candidatus Woesearchaeota archaeon]